MIDFMKISTRSKKQGITEIYPKFIINNKSSDLMIRGGDFYAVWIEELGLWSTDEQDVINIVDHELKIFSDEYKKSTTDTVIVSYMWDAGSGAIDDWHKYCQKQMRDNFHPLDETLTFSNDKTVKKDYASKRLDYPLEAGDYSAWDKLISTLYSDEERHKIEWAIGAIVTGASKDIQKFMVFYGAPGTGKSTILNIIQKLFDGYYSVFDAKALGSTNNAFALEAFKTNPLVAIQHDGDLSRIEDNTRLNSVASHEIMTVNEKFKSAYASRFNAFLLMGTNKPVRITDAKSGLIRRLIDVSPSGNKLPTREYHTIVKQINFELGAIAYHCREVYLKNPGIYDDYVPITMLGASNDFYNFIIDSYHVFKKENGTTLKAAWEMYKTYCDDAKVPYPMTRRNFQEELKNYFKDFDERLNLDDGSRVRSYYSGFRTDKFETEKKSEEENGENKSEGWIKFEEARWQSYFDKECAECSAQYATTKEIPSKPWAKVTTKLTAIDPTKLHYVKVPENHIVIDFDIKGDDGEKSFEKNLEAANKWPPTYAELSKGGAGIHLHYIYTGDPLKLSRVYDDDIEVKVFSGNSSLRRRLSMCNDMPISTISSGLPLKGEQKMVNFEAIKSEKGLRALIDRNLKKEIHPGTKPSIDFIYKILEDAYASDLGYDVSDMHNAILAFAANSTHQAEYCIKLVGKMKFKSEIPSPSTAYGNDDRIQKTWDKRVNKLIFYDIEVFPNLFLVNWKPEGLGKPVVRMINPESKDIEELMRYRLVGFNCRRYDNHILYARLMGYTNEQLYNLSQKIINNKAGCYFGEAYNVSYTDVYDFASSGNKKSLKKLEIEMGNLTETDLKDRGYSEEHIQIIKAGTHHQELGLPWDQPVPEELWQKVAEYCDNDVIATEAAFNYLKADWTAREILADLAEATVNDTTNSLTQKIIFGANRKPQSEFHYRNLAEPVDILDEDSWEFLNNACPKMMAETHGKAKSFLPYFPGYIFDHGKSIYRDEEVGEGGYVYAEPGMYVNVALLDISSMHPHSAIAEILFGVRFTMAFRDIVEGRVSIKHEDWHTVNKMLDGKLTPYIQKVIDGEMSSKDLANALKTAINSVYGLTSASFDNPFRDPRNVDNIVAKRGALFMVDLKHAVQERGFTVAHIKTDSIKIPNATPEIIQFVMGFGERYGYTFEHEATYDRMCLVNDAVYIAKYQTAEECSNMYNYIPGDNKKKGGKWTATGTQFQIPYVFKKLFSREKISFSDMCETKSVSSSLYLDMNEGLPDVSDLEKKMSKAESDYKKGLLSDTSFEAICGELVDSIAKGHDYRFVGKVGQFCPIKDGCGGGLLMREKDGKYYAANGSKGYRWLESEMVKELGKESDIDRGYYDNLVNDAVETISKYCDFEQFVSDDLYSETDEPGAWINAGLGLHTDGVPCADKNCKSCHDCSYFKQDAFHVNCELGYEILDNITKEIIKKSEDKNESESCNH